MQSRKIAVPEEIEAMLRTRSLTVLFFALAVTCAGITIALTEPSTAEPSTAEPPRAEASTESRAAEQPTTVGSVDESPPARQSTILVRAKGNLGTESVTLTIDGTKVATWPLTGSYQTFTHHTPDPATDIQVGHSSGPWPNAILVDYVDINGTRHQSEDPTTLSSGSWNRGTRCAEGHKRSEWLACNNGWFRFANGTSATKPSVTEAEQTRSNTANSRSESESSDSDSKNKVRSTPIVIFDTDIGPDIDDALALAMLHAYEKRGQAELAAVTVSRNSTIGAQYVDLLNTFYGRPNIPIGVYRGWTSKDSTDDKYTSAMVTSGRYPFSLDTETIAEGHLVMRDVLRQSPDNSVVIIQTGFSTNTARLLEQYPDLVARKAKVLSLAGGDNNMSGTERPHAGFNIKIDPASAKTVFDRWPTKLVQAEFDLGYQVFYPLRSIQNDFNYVSDHPIKASYLNHDFDWHQDSGDYYNMRSWDLLSVIAAIEDPADYFSPIVGPGRVTVDSSTGYTSYHRSEYQGSEYQSSDNHYVLPETLTRSQTQRVVDRMIELTSESP